MTAWQETITVPLGAPWEPFSVDVWTDPPMGAYLDLKEASIAAVMNPGDVPTIERAIASFGPLIASHTITDRDGKPLELSLRSMSSGLFLAVVNALRSQVFGGEEAGPFEKPATSPARSSRGRNRRRGTPSGDSPSG